MYRFSGRSGGVTLTQGDPNMSCATKHKTKTPVTSVNVAKAGDAKFTGSTCSQTHRINTKKMGSELRTVVQEHC